MVAVAGTDPGLPRPAEAPIRSQDHGLRRFGENQPDSPRPAKLSDY
jgi:hypothetical protein